MNPYQTEKAQVTKTAKVNLAPTANYPANNGEIAPVYYGQNDDFTSPYDGKSASNPYNLKSYNNPTSNNSGYGNQGINNMNPGYQNPPLNNYYNPPSQYIQPQAPPTNVYVIQQGPPQHRYNNYGQAQNGQYAYQNSQDADAATCAGLLACLSATCCLCCMLGMIR